MQPAHQPLLEQSHLYHLIRRIEHEARACNMQPSPAQRTEWTQRLTCCAETVDHETSNHVHRVGALAHTIALAADWPDVIADDLHIAARLHDLGKIGVPTAILNKPGRFNHRERGIMEMHTWLGYHLIGPVKLPLLYLTRTVILSHHERWDGKGYPQGLQGPAIPEAARIVALADVWDALTSDRPYRPAMNFDSARALLAEGRGNHFDPDLHDLFCEQLEQRRNAA